MFCDVIFVNSCLFRLTLNGEAVDFEPIIHSRRRQRPLSNDQRLQPGCAPPPFHQDVPCRCKNGGICEANDACNCLATEYEGKFCHKRELLFSCFSAAAAHFWAPLSEVIGLTKGQQLFPLG